MERFLTPGLTLHLPSAGQRLRLTESDKLQVQIQAYLDNIFDVGALLEDTETKNAVLEHMEELQEQVALVRAAPEPAESRPTEPPTLISGTGSRCEWGPPEFDLNPLGVSLNECSLSSSPGFDLNLLGASARLERLSSSSSS